MNYLKLLNIKGRMGWGMVLSAKRLSSTVGYGDYYPLGVGRILSTVEAIFGVFWIGVVVGIVAVKSLLPDKKSLVFSKYGYYSTEKQRFFVIFVNTSKSPIVNAQMAYTLKLGRENRIISTVTAAYVGDSVWDQYLGGMAIHELADISLYNDDGLKFGVSGDYGFSRFSTAVKYKVDEILVVRNSSHLEDNPHALNPKIGSEELEKLLHYQPEQALNILEYVRKLRAQREGQEVAP